MAADYLTLTPPFDKRSFTEQLANIITGIVLPFLVFLKWLKGEL
jgi:hypothetical protein